MREIASAPAARRRRNGVLVSLTWPVILAAMPGCDGLFYYPTREVYGHPQERGLHHESVEFSSGDGMRLHGWFFPAVGAEVRGTVVHCHGNAGNISGHFENVCWLPERGWNVLCFDYRGYGRSSGRPTRRGLIDDAHAAVDFVIRRPDVKPERIVLFGQSVGGSVAVVVAAERDGLAGAAVEGAFCSYREVASYHIGRRWWLRAIAWWVPHLLMSNGWNPIDYVGRVAPTPLLIVQGRDDDIVDWRMGQRLCERAGRRAWLMLVERAGHTEAFSEESPEHQALLSEFFSLCVSRRAGQQDFDELLARAAAGGR